MPLKVRAACACTMLCDRRDAVQGVQITLSANGQFYGVYTSTASSRTNQSQQEERHRAK